MSGRGFAGHVHRFGDRARQERLRGGHHSHVRSPGDRAHAVARLEGTIEDRQMLVLQIGGPFDRVFAIDVGQDRVDLRLIVTQRLQPQGNRLVDDLEHAATGQLLVFDQRDVRLDPGRVAIHQEADRAGRSQHRGLGIAEAMSRPAVSTASHTLAEAFTQTGRASGRRSCRPRRDASA